MDQPQHHQQQQAPFGVHHQQQEANHPRPMDPTLPRSWSIDPAPPLRPPLPPFVQQAFDGSQPFIQQAFDGSQPFIQQPPLPPPGPPSQTLPARPNPYCRSKYTPNWKNKRLNQQRKGKQPAAATQSTRKRPLENQQLPPPPHDGKRPRHMQARKRNPRNNTVWALEQSQKTFQPQFYNRLMPSTYPVLQNHMYQPPRLHELQLQNQVKAFGHFHKRFHDRPRPQFKGPRAPGAPLNTTSYLMRAKKSGGIASLVSPNPVTPAVLPTPVLSPFPLERGLAEEANKEWGVNGYGSMNGLIRLRSSEIGRGDDDDESGSDVEQGVQSVQQLEQRLDQDLSRFVLTYPSNSPQGNEQNLLETRMDDQDSHIAHLEEENIALRERLYLMQQEVEELRRRMHFLESGSVCDERAEASSEKSTADLSCL